MICVRLPCLRPCCFSVCCRVDVLGVGFLFRPRRPLSRGQCGLRYRHPATRTSSMCHCPLGVVPYFCGTCDSRFFLIPVPYVPNLPQRALAQRTVFLVCVQVHGVGEAFGAYHYACVCHCFTPYIEVPPQDSLRVFTLYQLRKRTSKIATGANPIFANPGEGFDPCFTNTKGGLQGWNRHLLSPLYT